MARPTKRTPERRAALLRALRCGDSYAGAARAAGMSPSLFRQWRTDDPILAAEVASAQREGEAEVARQMEALLAELRGETATETPEQAMRWLERHFPNEWGRPRPRRPERRTRLRLR